MLPAFFLRWRANWRARRATSRLRASGALRRVGAVAEVLATPTWKNVMRKSLTARMERGAPVKTAQEVADLALFQLRNRYRLDVDDVAIQVGWDPTTGILELTSSPTIAVVQRAYGKAG